MFEIERELKQEVQCWETEKQKRLDDLKELTAIEQSLCDIMHTTPMYIPSGVVPTREQIEKLRVHTDQLAKEKVSKSVILLTPLFLNEIVYRSVPLSSCVVQLSNVVL